MNDLPHIISMHHAGASAPASAAGASTEPGDLLGFLNQLIAQTTAAPADAAAADGQNGGDAALAAQISDTLKGLPLQDIREKLAALLQQQTDKQATGAADGDTQVQPSLISDLMAKFAPQLQAQTPTPGSPLAKELAAVLADGNNVPQPALPEMLNDIQPGSGDNTDLEKIMAQLKAQPAPKDADAAALDPAILDQLKDKVAALQMTPGTIDQKTLLQVKTDMIQSLKDQGMDQPQIDRYLDALAKFLKDGDNTVAPSDLALVPVAPQPVAATPTAKPAVDAPASVTPKQADGKDLSAPKEKADAADLKTPFAKNDDAAKTDPQLNRAAPASAGKEAAAPAAPQAAAPAQNLSAKISGLHVSPAIISALAGSDASDMSGFGSDRGASPEDMIARAAGLKPLNADTINGQQNFTNYMTAARGVSPAAVTQMVTLQMQQNMQNKISSMTINLHPAELGQMDIKLKFEKDGQVRAHMSVEKPETLAMLQKDSAFLEKTLQQNGVKVDEHSISFDLRQQRQQQGTGEQAGRQARGEDFAGRGNDTVNNNLQAMIAVQAQGYITQSGVNIMV